MPLYQLRICGTFVASDSRLRYKRAWSRQRNSQDKHFIISQNTKDYPTWKPYAFSM